jgi:hypothetical protein
MSEDGLKNYEFVTKFTAFSPKLRQMGANQGGGYKLELELSESEWDAVRDINDPALQKYHFTVILAGEPVK